MENKPNYYAVIPADVRYSDIVPAAKLLYGEITALSNELGYCWAKTSYFAELYNKDSSTIQRWMKALKEAGFISIELVYKQNSKEVEERRIYIANATIDPPTLKIRPPHLKNERDNSIYINTNIDYIRGLLNIYITILDNKETITETKIRMLRARLKDYTEEELLDALKAFSKDPWRKEQANRIHRNLGTFLAPTKIDKWVMIGRDSSDSSKPLTEEERKAFRDKF